MEVKTNECKYHISEKHFYKHINRKKMPSTFNKFLVQTMETFEPVQTKRSKKIYYKDGNRAIWEIHLPNPGIQGKNAFRMICIIDTHHKKVILCYIFFRNELQFKGSGTSQMSKIWMEYIKELKREYF